MEFKKPSVNDQVTISAGTDRYVYVVTAVSKSGKSATAEAPRLGSVDLFWSHKHACWKVRNGYPWQIVKMGVADAYLDPHF